MTDDDAVLVQARAWLEDGKGVALATVIGTWGSSPRPPGSMLAVNAEHDFVGSVSGGCIEGAVITEAVAAIADGKPRLLDFGVSDEQAWEVGLSCGGEMKGLRREGAGGGYLGRFDRRAPHCASDAPGKRRPRPGAAALPRRRLHPG